MENIETKGLDAQEPAVETAKEPEVDYKSLYEKLQKDNVNLDRYNKDLKAKYQAKMTEEEQRKAELEERENYYKNLEKELSKSKTKSLLKDVKDDKLSEIIADKFANGEVLDGLKELNKYYNDNLVNAKKQWQEELLMKNPVPPASNIDGKPEITKAQFEKMSLSERTKLFQDNPELYAQLRK
jgi:hypothetical protein